MSESYLTAFELGKRWSLVPDTLEKWRWRGIGPNYIKVGNRVLYPMSDVMAYERHGLNATRNRAPTIKSKEAMSTLPTGVEA